MIKNFKELTKVYRDEKKCIAFLVKQRWDGEPVCPHCGHKKAYLIENGKRFKCANNQCYKKFSVTVGTIFEASNIKLTTWFQAVYIILSHKKGISSIQLGKDLGVTQKTAWFMLHRIRESLKESNPELLGGTNEIDEAYMGRKFGSEYKATPPEKSDLLTKRQGHKDKLKKRGAVIGIYNRDTNTIRTQVFSDRTVAAIKETAESNVAPGSTIYSDESTLYRNSLAPYKRDTVNHWLREWVRGDIHVNHVENFWGVMKRGIYGIYHQVSVKHLQAYANEFSFRYNSRKLKDGERFNAHLRNLEGRLTYKQLVHGKGSQKESDEASKKEGE
jgi:transposase-like protein